MRRLFSFQKVITSRLLSPLTAVLLQLNHKIVATARFSVFMVSSPLKNLIHCYQQAFQLPIQEPASFFTWNKSLTTSSSEKSPASPTSRRNRLQHCMALLILRFSIQTAFFISLSTSEKVYFLLWLIHSLLFVWIFRTNGYPVDGKQKAGEEIKAKGDKRSEVLLLYPFQFLRRPIRLEAASSDQTLPQHHKSTTRSRSESSAVR